MKRHLAKNIYCIRDVPIRAFVNICKFSIFLAWYIYLDLITVVVEYMG